METEMCMRIYSLRHDKNARGAYRKLDWRVELSVWKGSILHFAVQDFRFRFSGEPLVLLQHVWTTEFPLLPNTQPYSTTHNIPSCPFHSPFSLQFESQYWEYTYLYNPKL